MAPTGPPGATALAFDPRAYVADLVAAGCGVYFRQPQPWVDGTSRDPDYVCIVPPGGRYSAASYGAVMAKWTGAMDACPDHVEQLLAYAATWPGAQQVPT